MCSKLHLRQIKLLEWEKSSSRHVVFMPDQTIVGVDQTSNRQADLDG